MRPSAGAGPALPLARDPTLHGRRLGADTDWGRSPARPGSPTPPTRATDRRPHMGTARGPQPCSFGASTHDCFAQQIGGTFPRLMQPSRCDIGRRWQPGEDKKKRAASPQSGSDADSPRSPALGSVACVGGHLRRVARHFTTRRPARRLLWVSESVVSYLRCHGRRRCTSTGTRRRHFPTRRPARRLPRVSGSVVSSRCTAWQSALTEAPGVAPWGYHGWCLGAADRESDRSCGKGAYARRPCNDVSPAVHHALRIGVTVLVGVAQADGAAVGKAIERQAQ